LSARSKHFKNILKVVFLLLVAAGIAFTIEYSRIQAGAEATGHIVAKHWKQGLVGPTSDHYEIVIEYQARGQRHRLIASRAVWDMWGELNTIGATVPVWYTDDGRAFIKRFNYLYPFTATLLGIAAIGLVTVLFLPFISQTRYEAASSRAKQYQQAKRRHRPLSPNRRMLLGRVHRLLFLLVAILGLALIGILRSSLWIYIAAIAAAILWSFIIKRALACPHCGASLAKDLKELDPSVVRAKTNWLIVRDYLAKGVPVTCSHCGHSLDD